jgi:Holliday junction resolvase RusA-like endonuclease
VSQLHVTAAQYREMMRNPERATVVLRQIEAPAASPATISELSVVIVVEGDPFTKGSMKPIGRRRNGSVIMANQLAGTKPWQKAVAEAAESQWGDRPLIHGPVRVDLFFRLPVPKTAPKRIRVWACGRRDRDKLERCVFDALSGVVYVDDALVVGGMAWKEYAYDQSPGVTIHIEALPWIRAGNFKGMP